MIKLTTIKGDITTLRVDAIVNAANMELTAGGGVCGAIFKAAGPTLAAVCAALTPCPTGDARITLSYGLQAKYIIHAVGPIWMGGGSNERIKLHEAYWNALAVAAELDDIRTIAFPCISTGIYGFPKAEAAIIATLTVKLFIALNPNRFDEVIFCCFEDEDFEFYNKLTIDK